LAYKFVFSLLIFTILLSSCDNLARDDLLDPKNEDGFIESVVLIEAFVNLDHPTDYNMWAVQGLDLISEEYNSAVQIVEYHRSLDGYPSDVPELDAQFTNMHQLYVDNSSDATQRAVPDIYINGALNRITGAESPSDVKERIEPVADDLIVANNDYYIIPNLAVAGNEISINCSVARLGNKAISNNKLKVIFIKDYNENLKRRVVVALDNSVIIESVAAGSYWQKDLGPYSFTSLPSAVIISLTSSDQLEVIQTTYREIKR